MREHYPTFKGQELISLVERLKDLEGGVDEEQKTLDSLRTNRDATDEELRNRTYEWSVHYELRVTREVRGKLFESWLADWEIVNPKVHRYGEYVETEEEARLRVQGTKREIADLRGQKVTIRPYPSTEEREGVVTDYNIYGVLITKGRFDFQDERNRILDEEKPNHQPKGMDWD